MQTEFRVEIAFSTGPMEMPAWEDITAYVRGHIGIRRGRQRELSRIEAGTASFSLDNRDRRFDPTNTAGPYYGQLVPMKRVRISTVRYVAAGGTIVELLRPLFTGYIERWNLRYDTRDAWVEVEAVDGFKLLAMARLIEAEFPEQLSSERVGAILDTAGWSTGETWALDISILGDSTVLGPWGDRVIEDGLSRVAYTYIEDGTALDALQETAEAEGGWLFIRKDGLLAFYNRHHTLLPAGGIYSYGFSNTSPTTHAQFNDLEVGLDDDLLYNHVIIKGTEIDDQEVEDSASIQDYFRRTLSISNDLIVSNDEAYQMANYLLTRYKEPTTRIHRLIVPSPNTAVTDSVRATVEIGDIVSVTYTPPPGTSSPVVMRLAIQGIEHDIDMETGAWSSVFDVYMLDPYSYWALDNEYCSLGTLTRLAW